MPTIKRMDHLRQGKGGGRKDRDGSARYDYGSRDFACRDPEGNLWSFGTYWPKANEKPMDA